MFRLLLTIFLVSAGVFIYSYFCELNPGMVLVRTSPTVEIELSPVTLVLISMAIGAVVVTFVVGLQQTAHAIINWQSSRLIYTLDKTWWIRFTHIRRHIKKKTVWTISRSGSEKR